MQICVHLLLSVSSLLATDSQSRQVTDSSQPKQPGALEVICHRGAHDTVPENTMAAFQRAVELGAPWVELDVNSSKDGVLYVLHDPWVDRVTDGSGWLRDMTSEQVDRLRVKDRSSHASEDHRIPRLENVLRWIRGKAKVNLDVKRADIPALIRLVYDTEMQNDVFFWFGNPFDAAVFRRHDKRLPVKVNVSNMRQLEDGKRQFDATLVETSLKVATPAFIKRANELGIKVIIACDSDDPDMIKQVINSGAAMVMTDVPKAFLDAMRAEK